MAKKNKTASTTTEPITLAKLSEMYLEHMEADGKSVGTCFSYTMELKTAIIELGATTIASEITPAMIEKFNNCDRVMRLKSGKPKAEPSFLKTRRVIRLALNWAAQNGLIASAPYATKDEPAPTPEPAKPSTAEKKTRRAKRTPSPAPGGDDAPVQNADAAAEPTAA